MVPNDESGRRIYRPVRSARKVAVVRAFSEAKRRAVLRVMDQYRRFGPKQVHAELRRTAHDISLAVIRAVFQQARRGETLAPPAARR